MFECLEMLTLHRKQNRHYVYDAKLTNSNIRCQDIKLNILFFLWFT